MSEMALSCQSFLFTFSAQSIFVKSLLIVMFRGNQHIINISIKKNWVSIFLILLFAAITSETIIILRLLQASVSSSYFGLENLPILMKRHCVLLPGSLNER